MIIDHQHVELKDPDCPSCEVDRIRVENDRLRRERNALIEVCVRLAAPLCMATDGTTASAIHHITSYVDSLLPGGLPKCPDCGEPFFSHPLTSCRVDGEEVIPL